MGYGEGVSLQERGSLPREMPWDRTDMPDPSQIKEHMKPPAMMQNDAYISQQPAEPCMVTTPIEK